MTNEEKRHVDAMRVQYEERIRNQKASIDRLLEHLAVAHGQFDHDCPGCPNTGEPV